MDTLIIIPTYNEIENVEALKNKILHIMPDTDILFVDDNSPDGTGEKIEELKSSDPRIKTLHRSGKLGLATAYFMGFEYALKENYANIFQMDCDFSHDPTILPDLRSALNEVDYSIGSRYVEGGGTKNWGILRRIISYCGNLYARIVLNSPIHDMTGSYVAWNRSALEAIDFNQIKSRGYVYSVELKYKAYKMGFRFKEIPFIFEDRRVGQSKMSGNIFVEAFLRVIKVRLGY